MKYPLNGKYSNNEIFQMENRYYISKSFTLPKHLSVEEILPLLLEYRKQLIKGKIKTTKIVSIKLDYKKNIIIITENFYPKTLEILFGTADINLVKKRFKQLLKIINKFYRERDKLPTVVIEPKPSNFVMEHGKLLYCDIMPPRALINGKLTKNTLTFSKPTNKKIREAKFRYLSKQGVIYYLILHCSSIRPELHNYFIQSSFSIINNKNVQINLLKKVNASLFKNDLNKFTTIYKRRRTLYNKIMEKIK